jgi:hypothetical protein
VKGGFFLRKKPLECVLSVYTNSENALVVSSLSFGVGAAIPSAAKAALFQNTSG